MMLLHARHFLHDRGFSFLFASLLLFAACGGDDNDENQGGDKPQPSNVVNTNRNNASTNANLARLEMPHVKGGTSEVISHSTPNYGVTYTVEWDHSLKAPRWVCYELNKQNFQTNGNTRKSLWPNSDPWNYDPDVDMSEQPATFNELSKSYYPGTSDAIYSKGHLCPSADRLYNKDANEQTYFMTNIMPMVQRFNSGIWNTMELRLRSWLGDATKRTWNNNIDTLFICKGGTVDQILGYTVETASVNGEPAPHVGRHVIPRYFFMALLAKKGNTYKALGFWAEHLNEDHSADLLGNYVVNIDELERLTGIDFFCNLPDDIEAAVEGKSAETVKSEWGLR